MKHLPSLNGLRAISILIVCFYHFNQVYPILPDRVHSVLLDGSFGVNVFFVISGFLITSILLTEESKTGKISLKDFYYRRTLRIFPAYYFLLLVYFIMDRLGAIQISRESWLTAVTYTKYFNWQLDRYTGHAWSLSIEEQFYLFWPLMLRLKKGRNLVMILLMVLVPVIKIYTFYHPVTWINYLTIFYRVDAIAIGCLVALNKEWLLKFLSPRWWLVIPVLVLLYYLPFIGMAVNVKYHLHIGFIIIGCFGTFGTAANICIAFMLLYSVYGPRNYWYKFLNLTFINQIGLWSYSIYLWQQMFLTNNDKWFNQYPLNIIFLVAASLLSYYLIEKPFLKLRDIKKAAIKAA